MRRIMAIAVNVPDVRHVTASEIFMHSLADAEQTILIAARKIQKPELSGDRSGIRGSLPSTFRAL